MSKLLMGKKLSDGSEVRFYKEKSGSYKFIVEGEYGGRENSGYSSLTVAIRFFKAEFRDTSNEPLTTAEQHIIDQFNDWDGNLQEMGSI
ncbi:hypothetical protein [Listeria booriae]|uniref:hypothetical protein n=1 Tax=Listeria booriae TaxID=1552123 RepID=UPI00164ED578|nr:hypothetical protein [Listeria booriae]MBC6300326.1 hypothetical protein [Listeria booriae]